MMNSYTFVLPIRKVLCPTQPGNRASQQLHRTNTVHHIPTQRKATVGQDFKTGWGKPKDKAKYFSLVVVSSVALGEEIGSQLMSLLFDLNAHISTGISLTGWKFILLTFLGSFFTTVFAVYLSKPILCTFVHFS